MLKKAHEGRLTGLTVRSASQVYGSVWWLCQTFRVPESNFGELVGFGLARSENASCEPPQNLILGRRGAPVGCWLLVASRSPAPPLRL